MFTWFYCFNMIAFTMYSLTIISLVNKNTTKVETITDLNHLTVGQNSNRVDCNYMKSTGNFIYSDLSERPLSEQANGWYLIHTITWLSFIRMGIIFVM